MKQETRHRLCVILALLAMLFSGGKTYAYGTNKGELTNLVCFVRFADEPEDVFENGYSTYQALFNDEDAEANSVFNYFYSASYGQLKWKSTFCPAPSAGKVVSYKTRFERAYYQKKGSLNEVGYGDDADAAARLQALVKEIAKSLSASITDGTEIDKNNDGLVDNLCIVFSGKSEISNKYLLWPKRNDLALPDEKAISIAGKRLVGYLMVFDGANGFDSNFNPIQLNTGVLCHEMSHSLGTYDLYHASGDLNPVGTWDLMSDNLQSAQGMTAYTKWRYCKWIDDIPEISRSGTYTLNPVGGDTSSSIAYKIKPVGSDEYFIVEYRRKTGFDKGLPQSGLIVYRINPAYTGGNVNYNGTTRLDEQYVFRPGGTVTNDGDISRAAMSKETGRTEFGGNADEKPFYSDGREAGFAIRNVSSAGDQISFDIELSDGQISLSDSLLTLNGKAQSAGTIKVSSTEDWTITGMPDWLTADKTSGGAGNANVTMTATSSNDTPKNREAVITIRSDKSKAQLRVIQQSSIVSAPSALKAEKADDGIHLTWQEATTDTPILYDDFENTTNPQGWTFETQGYRGWHYESGETDKGTYRPYEGRYAMTVYAAWEEKKQDESVFSPVFSNGTKLTFCSRTTASGRNPKDPQYYNVEVSSDGGKTWAVLFNACKDQSQEMSGKYQKVVLDLSEHMSATMKLRFHCYDTNGLGLSYYWQIDNVDVSGAESGYQVTGYDIYRNGVKVGSSAKPEYIDQQPTDGKNAYTVTAVGTFGESSPSETVVIDNTNTAIDNVSVAQKAIISIHTIEGTVVSPDQMLPNNIYIVRYSDGSTMKVLCK